MLIATNFRLVYVGGASLQVSALCVNIAISIPQLGVADVFYNNF